MVEYEEDVAAQWSQVENVYQRRADLIPNLVKTVKAYADFEKETLESVISARSKATSINIDTKDISPEKLAAFQDAQDALGKSLGRLMAVVEKYPELKADSRFGELQSQLEGAENRITIERRKFNQTVDTYNTYVRQFPQNLSASMFGFSKKAYFKAKEGAENVPEVNL